MSYRSEHDREALDAAAMTLALVIRRTCGERAAGVLALLDQATRAAASVISDQSA